MSSFIKKKFQGPEYDVVVHCKIKIFLNWNLTLQKLIGVDIKS